jgi:hypothetical protein
MRPLLQVGGAILIFLALFLLTLRVTGLDPQDRTPGLWLRGNHVTTPLADWSYVTDPDERENAIRNKAKKYPEQVVPAGLLSSFGLYPMTVASQIDSCVITRIV